MSQGRRIRITHTNSNPIGFQDVQREYVRERCRVEGKPLPAYLTGDYYKQTGAAFDSHARTTAQLDGLAGIAGFHLDAVKQEALFSFAVLDQTASRAWIESEGRRRTWIATAAQASTPDTFWDKLGDFRSRVMSFFSPSTALYNGPNPNVVVWRLTDPETSHHFPAAATEADGSVLRFDENTLQSVGKVDTMRPPAGMVVTTPAHYYEKNGFHVALEMETHYTSLPPKFTFRYAIYQGSNPPFTRVTGKPISTFSYTDKDKQPVECRPGYMHCYAQTNNYLILFVSSMRLNYGRLLRMDMSNGFFGLFDHIPEAPLEFIVFKIKPDGSGLEDSPQTFSDGKTSGHVWHMANAYEDNQEIVIDCSGTDRIDELEQNDKTGQTLEFASYMQRIRINVSTGHVSIARLASQANLEFPTMSPAFHFQPHKFVYVLKDAGIVGRNSLVKLNASTDQVLAEQYKDEACGFLLSEPVFVPETDDATSQEDAGVVLITVTDTSQPGTAWLAILDGKDLSELSRLHAPMEINAGLHSHFFSRHSQTLCKI